MTHSFRFGFTGIRFTLSLFGAAGAILLLPTSIAAQAPQTNLAVTVRHAPNLNGNGLIEGSLQQLLGEDVTLNGGFVIAGDLLEPGTPALRVNGHGTLAGIIAGSGTVAPGGYSVLLNGNCSLNYLRTRTTPVSLPAVSLPPQPAGNRNVIINNAGQSIGDASTLRNLTLNGNVGSVAIPPGTYGAFTANGSCGFALGVAGAVQPAIYNLQGLNLNGQSRLDIVGPVILTLAGGFAANGIVGTTNHPSWLQLQVASGGFTLNGGCTVHGSVSAPAGTVTVNGNSTLFGSAQCDRLIVNGGGRIKAGASPNQAPVADAQNLSVAEDTPLNVTLRGTDPEGAPLTCIVLSQPSHGTLSPAASPAGYGATNISFTYTPATNFNGSDSFTFKVNDGQADSVAATISIAVTPVNDPPTALSQKLSTAEDTALSITLAGTDVENDPLTFQVVTPPAHGTLAGSAPNLSYLPAPNYDGVDGFTFRANDGLAWSAPASVSITVQPVDDAPVASSQTVTTDEDTPVAVTVTALDVEGDGLTFSILNQPAHGTLSSQPSTPSQFTYTPATNYNGSDSFTFKANDGFLDSNPATVKLVVRPVNDPPIASPQTVAFPEDTATNIVLGGTDVDGDTLTFRIVTAPAHGTLDGIPPQLVYSPSADYNGADSFTFIDNDGQTDSVPATVSLVITPVNDPPRLILPGAQTIAENATLTFDIERHISISDVDAGTGLIQLSLSVSNGSVALASMQGLTCVAGANGSPHLVVQGSPDNLNAALLSLTYLGPTNFYGADDLTLAVNDLGNTGTGGSLTDLKTIAITVTRANVAPTVSITTPVLQSEFTPGQEIPINVAAADSDGQVALVRIFADDKLLSELTEPPFAFAWTDAALGNHVLLATATDDSGAISTSSNIVVSVVRAESGDFVVDAGPDQIISLPEPASLAGTVEIQMPATGGATGVTWSEAGGPGIVQFSDPDQLATTALFSEPGTYTLKLRANHDGGTRSDMVTVEVLPAVPNRLTAARSNRGVDFWLTFLPNESGAAEPNHSGNDLFISADVETEGKVTFTYGMYNAPSDTRFHLGAGATARITAGTPDVEGSDVIEAGAIHVIANHPVTVYGLSYSDYSTDGYLALPASMLGTNYIVLSYRNTPAFYDTNVVMGGTAFAVVAPEAETHVTITPTAAAGSRVAGVPYQITLQSGETYRLMNSDSPEADFTGTTISSDNPVAVFAGNKITTIPPITPAGDHLVEQLPPVNMWGRHFVTMPLATRSRGDTFRFLAQTNGTRVAVNGTIVATLDRGQFHEQMIDGPARILSSQPILVAQYANSTAYDGSTGDPFMMIIPPFEQFGGEYVISTPLHFWCYDNDYYYSDIYTNYVNLVVRTDGIGLIQLDGVPVPASNYQVISNTSYAGAQLPVNPGPHHLAAPVPFGVCIYGWAYCESYAFMGGVYSETVDSGTQLKLVQSTASAAIGTEKVVTARVEDRRGRPLADIGVDFAVSGAHVTSGHIATSLTGEATFSYTGTNAGMDVITATLVDLEESVTNRWIPATDNAPPIVSTAETRPLQFGLTAQLAGTAGDDGNPLGGTLNVHWRLLNGPADVLFENAAQLSTHASCIEPGIYIFELAADDSQFSSRSVATVRVDVLPTIQFPLSELPAIVGVGSNVLVTADAEDFDGSIDRVEFYSNDALIGISTNMDWWNGYNVIWTPATNGSYQLRAVCFDNFGGAQYSEAVTVTVTFPPQIEITLPVQDLILPFGASVATFKARASDPDGSVTNFAVYYVAGDAGPILIYQAAGDRIDYTGLVDPRGICYNYNTPHPLLWVATDDHGISTASYSVNITFMAPVVTAEIVSPAEDQVFHVGQPIDFLVEGSVTSPARITSVGFFQGARTWWGYLSWYWLSWPPADTSPYTTRWIPATAGDYEFSALVETDADPCSGFRTTTRHVHVMPASIGASITAPADSASLFTGHAWPIQIALDDPASLFDHAEFFANGTSLGQTTNTTLMWLPVQTGDYTLTAKVYDHSGQSYDAGNVVAVHVGSPPNPSIILRTIPDGKTNELVGYPILLVADASAASPEKIVKVEFFEDGRSEGELTNHPYLLSYIATNPGPHTVSARATTDFGTTAESLTLNIQSTLSLGVSWEQIRSGDWAPIGTNETLGVRLDDPGHVFHHVEFLANDVVLTSTVFMFYDWTPSVPGDYRLRARAYDRFGNAYDSEEIILHTAVLHKPQVSFVSPSPLARFSPGQPVNFVVQATDAESAVTNISLYLYSQPQVASPDNPMSYAWTNLPPGERQFTAIATDDKGLTGSAKVRVIVDLPVNADLLPPQNLAVQVLGSGGIQISWDTNSGVATNLVVVERAEGTNEIWQVDRKVELAAGKVTDLFLNAATTYRYRAYVQNADGYRSVNSEILVARTSPHVAGHAVLDLAESLEDAAALNVVQASDTKKNYRIVQASYLPQQNQASIVDMPALFALGISDFNAVLLGNIGPTNYIWAPGGTFLELSDTNFYPLRLTRSGFVVGSRLSRVTDAAGNTLDQYHAGYWDNAFFDLTPDVRALREPMTLPPLSSSYPVLDSLADMSSSGVGVGAASWVLVYPLNDQASGLLFGPVRRATVWPGNNQPPVNFGALQQMNNESAFNAINDAGDIVGVSALSDPNLPNAAITHAIRSQLSLANNLIDKLTDLGTLGGIYSAALAINSAGVAVGYSTVQPQDAITNARAVYWLPTETQPRQLPGYGASLLTYAWAVNNGGQIVGDAVDTNGVRHAALWKSATNGSGYDLVNLNDLVRRSDWHLDTAHSINSAGFIVGSGTHLAQVTVQNQAPQFVMFPRAFLLIPDSSFAVDYNRDGKIELDEKDALQNGRPYQFWVNDDSDGGTLSAKLGISDLPGAQTGIFEVDGRDPDYADDKVNGAADLVDWFPVYLNISNLLAILPPSQYEYRLVQADGALNFLYTDLRPEEAGSYLTNALTAGFGDDFTQPVVTATGVHQVTPDGVVLSSEFLDKTAHEGRGVLLFEARQPTTQPLRLEVRNSRRMATSIELPLQISGAEDMYGWVNLRDVAGGPVDRYTDLFPLNWPSFAKEDQAFVFLHGYNVNEKQSRAWSAEMFKRLWWSGSHRRFYAVSWFGDDTQVYSQFTINYHTNVIHAVQTAPMLATFLKARSEQDISVAAHSLGNMVVCSAIQDYEARPTRYFMVDSAVAMEAFDGGLDKQPLMTHPDWTDYPERLYASEWYQLFPDSDSRRGLTWRNRFQDVSKLTQLYNFYSSGEEVCKNRAHESDPEVYDLASLNIGLSGYQLHKDILTGENAWNLQELLKGRVTVREIAGVYGGINLLTPAGLGQILELALSLNGVRAGNILGSQYGGWGFNGYWDTSGFIQSVDAGTFTFPVYIPGGRLSFPQAAALTGDQLKTNSFFLPFFDARLYQSEGNAAASEPATRTRLLAEDVPARTFVAGANGFDENKFGKGTQFNMNAVFQMRGWPVERINDSVRGGRWLHSDWHAIPYLYNGLIFDKFVELEGGR